MSYAIMTDFGSTYTKMVCVDLMSNNTVATTKVPSTVHEDASIGMQQCLDAAAAVIGRSNVDAAEKFATSSAAGGLRIAVSGLTKTLSNAAGRAACFSAGGKLVCSSSGTLTQADAEAISSAQTEIVLLCGGYEKGNNTGIVRNAEILSKSDIRIPVIYAGNSEVSQYIRGLFISRGKECFLAENIIPEVKVLNEKPTTDIIRELFLSRITNMKGVGGISAYLAGPIMPTPQAVLRAGELLSRGTGASEGLGDFMMVDLGGATTDVYSFCSDKPYKGAHQIGIEEPYAKRTVEGDLGMRESSASLMEEMGCKAFADACGISEDEARAAVIHRDKDRAFLADTEIEKRIDHVIASCAVRLSVRRHAGTAEKGFMDGVQLIQRGKNLTNVKRVIGTGGIIVNNADPHTLLHQIDLNDKEQGRVLLPQHIDTMVDTDYVMFAAGLLAEKYPEAALSIMKKSIGLI